jgi:hypothetical protein
MNAVVLLRLRTALQRRRWPLVTLPKKAVAAYETGERDGRTITRHSSTFKTNGKMGEIDREEIKFFVSMHLTSICAKNWGNSTLGELSNEYET